MFGGLLGIVIFALDIWAILSVFGSSATGGTKLVWTLVILLLPVLGLIIWFFAGPRKAGGRA
jgi:hypothetical protein